MKTFKHPSIRETKVFEDGNTRYTINEPANLEYRALTANDNGTFNLQIKHPVWGWVEFTASPNDEAQHGRDIYAMITAGAITPDT